MSTYLEIFEPLLFYEKLFEIISISYMWTVKNLICVSMAFSIMPEKITVTVSLILRLQKLGKCALPMLQYATYLTRINCVLNKLHSWKLQGNSFWQKLEYL